MIGAAAFDRAPVLATATVILRHGVLPSNVAKRSQTSKDGGTKRRKDETAAERKLETLNETRRCKALVGLPFLLELYFKYTTIYTAIFLDGVRCREKSKVKQRKGT